MRRSVRRLLLVCDFHVKPTFTYSTIPLGFILIYWFFKSLSVTFVTLPSQLTIPLINRSVPTAFGTFHINPLSPSKNRIETILIRTFIFETFHPVSTFLLNYDTHSVKILNIYQSISLKLYETPFLSTTIEDRLLEMPLIRHTQVCASSHPSPPQ